MPLPSLRAATETDALRAVLVALLIPDDTGLELDGLSVATALSLESGLPRAFVCNQLPAA
jgi:hypothetical protein